MMNRNRLIILFIGLLFCAPAVAFSQSPEATESAPLETIKENVKKRIQEVVEKKTDSLTQTAYIGKLISRTTTSLTLETNNGSQLASGSAQVVVEDVHNNAKSSFEDLEIGDYMSIIGSLDDQDVLIATKVLLSTEPKPPTTKHLFATVKEYDSEEDVLIAIQPGTNEESTFDITSKSVIEQAISNESRELDPINLIPGMSLVILYKPGTTPNDAAQLIRAVARVSQFIEPEIEPTLLTPSPAAKTNATPTKSNNQTTDL